MSFLAKKSERWAYPHEWCDTMSQALLFFGTLALPLFVLPFTRDAIDLPKELLLAGLALASFLLWLLRGMAARELYIRRTTMDAPVGVFLFLLIAASFASISPGASWLGRMGLFVNHASIFIFFVVWWWLMVQYIRSVRVWHRFLNAFLVSGAVAGLLYVARHIAWVQPLSSWFGFNTVSQSNSAFGVFMAIVGVVAFGFCIDRDRALLRLLLPAAAALMSIVVLFRVGFAVAWIVFAVGLALLIIIGSVFLSEARIAVVSGILALFLASVFFAVFGAPTILKERLPAEVALGAGVSWDISAGSLLSGARSFLIGSGPGTYAHAFSLFRPAEFNAAPYLWTSRFHRAYNVPLTLIAETGVLGFLSFVFLALFHIGTIIASWYGSRASVVEERFAYMDDTGTTVVGETTSPPLRLGAFVIAAAWVAATVGLCLSFYTVLLWWLWWWLLAASIFGLARIATGAIREQTLLLAVSPQYSLALSFAMVLILGAALFFGIYARRFYVAEIAYTKAVRAGNIAEKRQYLDRALQYRPASVEYRLALAAWYFQEAKAESDKGPEQAVPDVIASRLSAAVGEARHAAELDPKNVETWEALSLMYLNARVLAADANEWSREAAERALALEPTNPTFYWRLGNINEFASKFNEAEALYKRAIELKPDYVVPYVALAELYEGRNDLTVAIRVFEPIMPLLQNDAELLFNLGRLLYNRNAEGDNERAETLWLRAIVLRPAYSNVLYSLGLLYERMGDAAEAREYFEVVRELNPDNPGILKKLQSL